MAKSPYFYFMHLYKESNDAVLCVDENMKVVYISSVYRETYDYFIHDDILINCFIPSGCVVPIKNAIAEQKSFSIDFVGIQDDLPKRCFIMPVELDGEKFASLLIIDNAHDIHDRTANKELKHAILEANRSIHGYSEDVIYKLRKEYKDHSEDMTDDPIFINTMKIRHEAENLSLLARKDLRVTESLLVDVNKYIERAITIIMELLGKRRISFETDFQSKLLITEMQYDVFDTLISNTVSTVINGQKGHANIVVRTIPYASASIVSFSTSSQGCEDAEATLMNLRKGEDNIGIPAVNRIIEVNDCKIVCIPNPDGGNSVAFTLPPARVRNEMIRDPVYDTAQNKGFLSALASGLADLLDLY